jgi:hypothetical protein
MATTEQTEAAIMINVPKWHCHVVELAGADLRP